LGAPFLKPKPCKTKGARFSKAKPRKTKTLQDQAVATALPAWRAACSAAK
jgi:hypothetical protein